MGVITIYTCDRCKKTIKKTDTPREDFYLISVRLESHFWLNNRGPNPVLRGSWCENCVTEVGLPKPGKFEEQPAPKTALEDALRELIREEIENG